MFSSGKRDEVVATLDLSRWKLGLSDTEAEYWWPESASQLGKKKEEEEEARFSLNSFSGSFRGFKLAN